MTQLLIKKSRRGLLSVMPGRWEPVASDRLLDAVSVLSLFVTVLGPVIAIVAIGALTGRRLGVDIQSLSRLAYWVLGPAFVFDIFATSDLAGSVAARLFVAAVAGMVAAAAVMLSSFRLTRSARSENAADLMTAVYGNVGNTGLAVSVFALGDDILDAAGVLMLTINIIGMMVGISLAASQSVGRAAAIKRALLAPMTLAALVAIPVNVGSIAVPTLVDRSVGLLAGALIPVMLYTMGIQLTETRDWSFSPGLGASALAKLLVAPLAAFVVASAIGLTGDNLAVVAIQSAMPPAIFCIIVANEHKLEPERVATNVAAMTLLSLLTLPVVLVLTVS